MKQHIVIVGAGYAGILTAKKLARRFKKDNGVDITIIDKNPFHTMLTELHEVAAGRVEEDSIKMDLKKVFSGRDVLVVMDTVQSIDFAGRRVHGISDTYRYDYLVLAAGCKPAFFGVEGAEEFTYKLWSYDDAVKLRERIDGCFRRASRAMEAEERRRLLTFHVVGAGFTGVEMAGELAEYVPVLCRRHGVDAGDVAITIVDILPRLVPVLPEKLSGKVGARLEKMGVKVRLETGVEAVGPHSITLREGEAVNRETAGTVIWTAGTQASSIAGKVADILPSKGRGRLETDQYLRSLGDSRVFVAGDNLYYIPAGEQHPVPQMVENCEQGAGIVAHNIAALIEGDEAGLKPYQPGFHGVMVSVGGRYGVAHVGTPKRLFALPSFLAMLAKHFINVVYFVQVLGWNKVFSYLKHEFFTIRHNRSFLGGHFSNKIPNFFLVPLRIWLGLVWVFEGVMKIAEGWFTSPKLEGFFGGANAWYAGILGGTATTPPDSTSSASVQAASAALDVAAEAGAATSQVLVNLNLGLFRVLFVSGKELVHTTLSDLAFKLQIPLLDWFLERFVLSSDGMQVFMQAVIVTAEILIGLALIGGLFTTPAAAASLGLQAMFVTTTGLYLSTAWMFFGGIAVLVGGGRVLGLDYYAMPWLSKKWKSLPWVRRSYLYHD